MTKARLIGVTLLSVLALFGAGALFAPPRTQIVGTLSSDDEAAVLMLARRELRTQLLPKFNWDNMIHPRRFATAISRCWAQHILWVEVYDSEHVRVFAGDSKDSIRDRGCMVVLRNNGKWERTAYTIWWSSNTWSPGELRIPADHEH